MIKLAAIQMSSGDNVASNLKYLATQLQVAADAGAGLVVLPENFALLSEDKSRRLALAETDGDGPVQNAVAELAGKFQLWIVAGTVPIKNTSADSARPYSACCVYNAQGQRVARYDKIHLFDVRLPDNGEGKVESYAESSFSSPGTAPLALTTPWGRLGVAVCYDLRFPEQFRQMAAAGLDLIALPAAFTVATGKAHWEVLLRARAIENQCYVVAAAQVGTHPGGRKTWGHSMIVDAWGQVLADAGAGVGVVSAAFDRDAMEQLRGKFPVLQHRRL